MFDKFMIHLYIIVSDEGVIIWGISEVYDTKSVGSTFVMMSFHNGGKYTGNHYVFFPKLRTNSMTLYGYKSIAIMVQEILRYKMWDS